MFGFELELYIYVRDCDCVRRAWSCVKDGADAVSLGSSTPSLTIASVWKSIDKVRSRLESFGGGILLFDIAQARSCSSKALLHGGGVPDRDDDVDVVDSRGPVAVAFATEDGKCSATDSFVSTGVVRARLVKA